MTKKFFVFHDIGCKSQSPLTGQVHSDIIMELKNMTNQEQSQSPLTGQVHSDEQRSEQRSEQRLESQSPLTGQVHSDCKRLTYEELTCKSLNPL